MNKFLYLILVSLTLFSCRKENTIWYSDWLVPLYNDTLNLQNLTNDSTLAIQNGNYILDLNRKIASIKPSEYVKIPDTLIEQKFAIGISSLNVPPGTSFVNNNEDQIFDLDEIELKKAQVKTGKIYLEVYNPIATQTFFEIELPSVTKNNVSLKSNFSVNAGTTANPSSKSIEIDLSSYTMDLTGTSGSTFNALPSKIKVSTDPNGNSVNITAYDSTRIIIRIENIILDYARGYFGNYKVADSYDFESSFLKNQVSGALDIPNLSLSLDFINGIKVSAKANLKKLNNINTENSNQVLLTHPIIGNPFTVETATGAWSTLTPSTKQIVFDAGNSNIESFIENLGETTQIDYEIELNPWGNISGGWDEFFPESSFDVIAHAQMPLNIGLNQLTLSNSFDVNFSQDSSSERVSQGNIILKIENAFPLEGQIALDFYDVNGNLIQSVSSTSKIQSSVYGSITSFGILSKKSEIALEFPAELLAQLDNVKNIKAAITFNTPNATSNVSEIVSIPEKAFLKLKIQSSFKLENQIKR